MAYKIKKDVLKLVDNTQGRVTLAHTLGQGENSIKALIAANTPNGNLTKLAALEAMAAFVGLEPSQIIDDETEKEDKKTTTTSKASA